jgi:hypothetical protein
MLTNKLNLPSAVVTAVQNDPYSRGKSDISVTQLITPPYQRKLRQTVESVEDVADKLFALYGQIGHGILERAGLKNGSDVENRLFSEVSGWTVSGQYDLIEDGVLMDYKFTTFWSVKGDEPKPEWVQQLNLLRVLAIRNGIEVRALRIIALLRDHQKSAAERDPEYPQFPIVPVDIPMWDLDKAEAFMLERVKLHQQETPEPCSDEDRWLQPAVFALKKNGVKKAVKLFNSLQDAEAAMPDGKGYFVEHRPGEYRRCASYCNVSHGCPVWQKTQETPF